VDETITPVPQRCFAVKYTLTHYDPDDNNRVTAMSEHYTSMLFSADSKESAEEQARAYFTQYVRGTDDDPGLAMTLPHVYPNTVIDWQIVQLVPAEQVADALVRIADAISS
jgi:hypothetical protein